MFQPARPHSVATRRLRPSAPVRTARLAPVAGRRARCPVDAPRRQVALRALLTRRGQFAAIGVLVLAAALAWWLIGPVHEAVSDLAAAVRAGDQQRIGDELRSLGPWGPVLSLGLMVVQGVAAPIPGALIVFANGIAYGVVWGTVLSVAGQTLAALTCFWLARLLGRGAVESMVGRLGLTTLDRWVGRWGAPVIVLLRLVPGVAFDGVSFGAGLLDIRLRTFLAATVIGIVPQSLFYTWAIRHHPAAMMAFTAVALAVTAAVTVTAMAIGLLRRRRQPAGEGR